MRIAISGTHGSRKSTLIADFAAQHPHYQVMPDPFELIDETDDQPGPAMLLRQLRIAADRLEITGDRATRLAALEDALAH